MDGTIVFARWRQCVLPWGHISATWWIRLNLCFLWPSRVHNPNGKSTGSEVFAQHMEESPYILQWVPLSLQNCPFPWGDLDPHLTCNSLGLSEPTTQTASQSVQPFLQGSLVWQRPTDRQTDHTTWQQATIGCIYVRSTAIWPNNSPQNRMALQQQSTSLDNNN